MTAQQNGSQPRFGTFLGVFLPSVLTILGVMMYLRFGWVIGNAGLPLALLILLMASSITFITGLSASAISTNMKVGVGGEYFMVSRSLGLELGGAIGIPLFLCRTLSLTLYAFGLAESLGFVWPRAWGDPPQQWIAAVIIVVITAISGRSAALALKLQIPIFIAVGLSLLALLVGVATGGFDSPEMAPHYERSAPLGFWYVFAVFFPAVTGFTAGIGMSGDLKDPMKSIPRGTILAVVAGAAVYAVILLALAFTGRVSGEALARLDPGAPPVWANIAFLGLWLVFPGMCGAILSSAFGSALSGPRVLQALALDRIAPRLLARTTRTGQPMVATWITGLIALGAVALGDLNAVGRWVTIFFLTLYVMINLAAAIERMSGDPSFRPTIRLPWIVSLAGCIAAVVVMFLIHPLACIAALALEAGLYLLLRRRALETTGGDVRAGMWVALARFALLKLRHLKRHARNWRPQILLFTANPASRVDLVRMANWFNQNRGVVTVCQVIVGDLDAAKFDVGTERRRMETVLQQERLGGFCEVNVVPEFESGIVSIGQANGFAGLQSNTVMFGWPDDEKGLAVLLRIMRAMSRINVSTILAKLPRGTYKDYRGRIDIWWRGLQHNGDLMLLLAYLLNLNPGWTSARLSLRTIVDGEDERKEMQEKLHDMISEVRIQAESDVVVLPEGKPHERIMHEASEQADVVFLGLRIPAPGQEQEYARRLIKLASGFSTAVFVRNASPFRGKLV
jgi:amino acid transporter